VMTPLDLLARLAAIVPPPRYPLLRYHGVLAPRSSWRRDIVPRAPAGSAPKRCSGREAPERQAAPAQRDAEHAEHAAAPASAGPATKSSDPSLAFAPAGREPDVSTSEGAVRTRPTWIAPNILSVRHWNRLLGGLLYAASPRVDWATLLRRSFDVDVLRCSACGGRMRVLAEVIEPALVSAGARGSRAAHGGPCSGPRPRSHRAAQRRLRLLSDCRPPADARATTALQAVKSVRSSSMSGSQEGRVLVSPFLVADPA
jgi:hypothetical protein